MLILNFLFINCISHGCIICFNILNAENMETFSSCLSNYVILLTGSFPSIASNQSFLSSSDNACSIILLERSCTVISKQKRLSMDSVALLVHVNRIIVSVVI